MSNKKKRKYIAGGPGVATMSRIAREVPKHDIDNLGFDCPGCDEVRPFAEAMAHKGTTTDGRVVGVYLCVVCTLGNAMRKGQVRV